MTNREVIVARAQHANLPPIGFIRAKDLFNSEQGGKKVKGVIPITPATAWTWIKKGTFPRPVKLGPATSAWSCEAIHQWMEAQSNGL